ncbi:hypothetical protein FDENT_6384 [Fusarium denticulatum]|uniref:RanBP2-type domain-containing protein n=1 Tax=Fusarium denticulatum TaxID=48507 RepID=A0A8H5UCT8_9HYPO|nr:hypothetical protein FDENT_6384 [Fusarium denticulatum]
MVLFSTTIVIVFISFSINIFINTHTHSRHTATFTPSSLHSMQQPTPPSGSSSDHSAEEPLSASLESISFTGTTTKKREDHLKWICLFMSCDTVNCMYENDCCKQCGTKRQTPADALDDKGGSTDPEDSSPPSEISGQAGAPGSSGSCDAVGTNRDAGTVTTGDGSEASHTEGRFENGQRLNWDDDDDDDLEDDKDDEDYGEDEDDEDLEDL